MLGGRAQEAGRRPRVVVTTRLASKREYSLERELAPADIRTREGQALVKPIFGRKSGHSSQNS